MAKTTWAEAPFHTSHSRWLFADGTQHDSPMLETTTSGRRVRLKDYPEISGSSKEIEGVTQQGMTKIAERNGTALLRKISTLKPLPPPEIDLSDFIHRRTNYGEVERNWRFCHPTLPLTATVTLTLTRSYRSDVLQRSCTIKFADLNTMGRFASVQRAPYTAPCVVRDGVPGDQIDIEKIFGSPNNELFDLRDESLSMTLDWFGRQIAFLEGISQISLPDTRDGEGEWLTYEFESSTVLDELSFINNYFDGHELLAEAALHYAALQKTLRQLGLTLSNLSENSFARALNGEESAIEIKVRTKDQVDHTDDRAVHPPHDVHFDLARGAVGVGCPYAPTNGQQDEPSAYEMARFSAEVNGELEQFLNVNRSARHQEQRTVFVKGKRTRK